MSKTNKKIDLEIHELESRIDKTSIEEEDDTKEIKDFRQRVFFVHHLIEMRMIPTIVDKTMERVVPERALRHLTEKDFTKWSEWMGDIAVHVRNLSYLDKLKLAASTGAVRGKLLAKVRELNNLRNVMGHTRDNKYKKFLEKKNRLIALRKMVWIIEKTEDQMPFFDKLDEELKKDSDEDIPF